MSGDLSFSSPTGTGTYNVGAMQMPGIPATSGTLCSCGGSLADQGAGMYFSGVYIVNKAGFDQTITDGECTSSPYFAQVNQMFNGAAISWSLPATVQASLTDSGKNSIKALAVVFNGTNPVSPAATTQINYTATRVDSCT
jgi:hypothetical protein